MAESKAFTRTRTYPISKHEYRSVNKRDASTVSNRGGEASITNDTIVYRDAEHDVGNDGQTQLIRNDFISIRQEQHRYIEVEKGRTHHNVRRTDSYRLAAHRRRSIDDLDKPASVISDTAITARTNEAGIKSNTMPNRAVPDISKPRSGLKRKSKYSQDKEHTSSTNAVTLTSRESGMPTHSTITAPLPSRQEQNGKGVFQRIKERLIQTLSRKGRTLESKCDSASSTTEYHGISPQVNTGKSIPPASENSLTPVITVVCVKPDVGGALVMERETGPHPKESPTDSRTSGNKTRTNVDREHLVLHSDPMDIPKAPHQSVLQSPKNEKMDRKSTGDDISGIFGSLIDPSTPFLSLRHQPVMPDRSNLKLEGLRKYRPKSFDRQSTETNGNLRDVRRHSNRAYSHGHHVSSVGHRGSSPLADAVFLVTPALSEASPFGGGDDDDADLMPFIEHQRRLYDYGRRFAALGDRLVSDRNGPTDKGLSGTDEIHENEFIKELKTYTDLKTAEMLGQGGINASIFAMIQKLATAPDYTGFEQILAQELSQTIRSEQVAWYTYLIKMTMCVVGTGQTLGKNVSSHALRYFNTFFRPWIESRPNGWDSIYEETHFTAVMDHDIDDPDLD